MKKFAIFISYSRKDYWDKNKNVIPDNLVSQIVERLDAYKEYYDFEYFFDLEDITSEHDYLKRISKAILDSEVLLFVSSKNSTSSEFCSKELLFAEKKHKAIHQYRIEDFEMPDDIDMLLCNHQYREASSFSVDNMVREVLANAMGCDITSIDLVRASSRVEVPQPISARIYRVGDYYNENGREGVVFDVTDSGVHGKIVSLEESPEIPWCTQEQYDKRVFVGASSKVDGYANTRMILEHEDREKYPAFIWCRSKGEGWYLPAVKELKMLYAEKDRINNTLRILGRPQLSQWLWSSTERENSEKFCAWFFLMLNGDTVDNKCKSYNVRAVATF